jgi:2-aminobenzoylacetyl-CoA thioesterase
MVRDCIGKITDGLYGLGNSNFPVYLLLGKNPVLFDAGLNFMGPAYLQEIKKHLGEGNPLQYLFLTHSHFDHCGAAPYLKRNIPGLKVAASQLAADVLKRPNAVQLIRSLNREMEEERSEKVFEDIEFDRLDIDQTLKDGEVIQLEDGIQIQVIATPGHTRDALCFYIPHLKALMAGEMIGVFLTNSDLRPEFLSSYDDYISSLENLKRLDIRYLVAGHFFVVTDNTQEIIRKAIDSAQAFAGRIQKNLDALGGDPEAVIQKIFQEDYIEQKIISQAKRPYLLNLSAQVKTIAAQGK